MKHKRYFLRVIVFFFLMSFILHSSASASDLTSTNFIVRDPVIGTGGGYSSSGSFKLFSEGHDSFSDVSNSLSFIGHYGFLYFPFFSSGTLSATPSGTSVNLSWTVSTSAQGWSVSGYRTGISNVSGGPYTYTNVGNVLSYSYNPLTAGNYCFVVETLDAFSNVIGDSNEVCTTVVGGGGPGGGGGGGDEFDMGVRFTGQAYPRSSVRLLKEGNEVQVTQADSRGYFNLGLEENVARSVIYTLFAIDVTGNKSLLINYPVVVRVDSVASLSGVLFVPTINTDKSVVKFGDFLKVSGYAIQNKELEILIEDGIKKSFSTFSGEDGSYALSIPMGTLARGEYKVYVKYKEDPRFSKLIRFTIGDANVWNKEEVSSLPGDCNFDRNINLVDFSILAFWYGKDNPPECVDTNKDRIINLVDFSILAFYWTG